MARENNLHVLNKKQIPKKRIPGPVGKLRFDEVAALLEEFRSVTITAEILGVTQCHLSHYLRAKHRVAWWKATKTRWSIENKREAARRYYWRRAHGTEPPPAREGPKA